MIRNPVLTGFNPDPSFLRVGDDYYLATSTFEWFPGIQIHHSRDLVHWRLVSRPLNRPSQLDLRGVPDGCGLWAPCLSHRDGLFFLTYSLVLRYGRTTVSGADGLALRDFHNFLVTAPSIAGEWSDPVALNSSGFDPSLFHDEDGRSYLLNMLWDHRSGQQHFAGILLQEYDIANRALVGERRIIYSGTTLGFTEGPHLLRRNGWYYLIVAEGGTGWDHAVTMARSRHIDGPYETCPTGPILTSRGHPDRPLQRAGHGDLVQASDGSWLIAYLCGRPVPGRACCVMGRETAIQPMRWRDDGWPETLNGDALPALVAPSPQPVETPPPDAAHRDFDQPHLPGEFQWLRSPQPERLFSLTQRPGFLRLFGRESLGSQFEQALVARRQQDFCFQATTRLDYAPRNFQQSAGLVLYYNARKYHYCYITCDESTGRRLRLMSGLSGAEGAEARTDSLPLSDGPVEITAEVIYDRLRFGFRQGETADWTWFAVTLDMCALSDEAGPRDVPNFTGTFVGMACQDMSGERLAADFDGFCYQPLPAESA
ncbi:glycoside hydrolase family 43 protein [Asticcacaulis sp. EMRT-3]|uniref:glycoside hydrolase family 43 protein n=1 Tax=Asticcacaulis sp. EMRT-3 TaxID=3040349 RepID=UPI0024AFC323|nr:glycoside hydrolase family 43 protein [Asticcacaulis sp. EMRT-3]MDI7776633.1 glycoside hydrolase family 43 protein [Asticcacaulis sp. EMRT-3]